MGNVVPNVVSRSLSNLQSKWYGRLQEKFGQDFSFSKAAASYSGYNNLYAYMHHHFYNLCPPQVREHRMYYKQSGRGFGEDAFHAMWFTLLREFKPQQCLEIGVYRGQVISLWALIARDLGFPCNVHGISPFTSAGDEVSVYMDKIDYFEDTLQHHNHFELHEPTLVSAYSTDPVALAHIRSRRWNLIYIDGNHDYEVALADYEICKDNLADDGLLVMDDSSVYADFQPPRFSFAGHPGPSRVVQERAMKELCFVGGVGHNNVFMRP
ncbi:class I SAM-dependent methyltransferase [Pseudomonadota bacterium]